MGGRLSQVKKAKRNASFDPQQASWSLINGWFLALLVTAALWPEPSYAITIRATSLGDILCNLEYNAGVFPSILGVTCYIAGVFLIIFGVFTLRKHVESGGAGQSQIVPGIAKLFVGGVLTCLPTFAKVLQASFVGTGGAKGDFGCVAGSIESSDSASLDQILTNFVKNIHTPMFMLLSGLSVIVGLLYIARGLLKASKIGGGDPRAAAPNGIIVNFVVGAILISMGQMLGNTTYSIFGRDTINSMSTFSGINWSKITDNSGDFAKTDAAIKAVLSFVQIIGGIAFLRGWLIVKSAVEGGGQTTVPQGVSHIVGGTMALNIDRMLKIMDTTFGTSVLN